ncbi:phospholipase D-like domain-containing protein [Emcibacter sp.]|uniref:phospholipase D-like domain-containing protein n=1 Tax=Emcibacter sp. TaxID=1979954 RepID=UPI003A928638
MNSQVTDYYTTTPSAWEAMLAECRDAEKSIRMEEYIFHPDSIGNRFIDLFIAKAREGVDVRLLLDWYGCLELIGSSRLKELENAGVRVCFFNKPRLAWLKRFNFFPRDHRKILMIDERSAYIGGVCIYDTIHDWRDSMLRLEGKVIQQLRYIFEQSWAKSQASDDEEIDAHPDFETDGDISIQANAPESGEHYFIDSLLEQIDAAEKSVKLATPYFTPDQRLSKALVRAVQRGVDVQILLSDYSGYAPYVVGKHCCGGLLAAGIRINYYEPSMLHLKMMIVDGNWAAIGSCNLDGLSLHQNHEAMLVSNRKEIVETLGDHFSRDLAQSPSYEMPDWRGRPLKEKLAGYLFYPFRRYL